MKFLNNLNIAVSLVTISLNVLIHFYIVRYSNYLKLIHTIVYKMALLQLCIIFNSQDKLFICEEHSG